MHSFEKDLPAIDCIISPEGRDVSFTGLSRQPTLHQNTVHRMPAMPVRNRYMQQTPHTGKYDPGLRFLDRECVLNSRETLGTATALLLKQLYYKSGETISAAI